MSSYQQVLRDAAVARRARLWNSPAPVRPARAAPTAAPVIVPVVPLPAHLGAPLTLLGACSPRFLLAYSAAKHGVTVEDILGHSRARAIVAVRHEAMALVYQHTQCSMPGVGRLFGRDHTSVLHALQKLNARRKLAELLPSADAARRTKSRELAQIARASRDERQNEPPRVPPPPRSEDPHTPRTALQKAIVRAYKNHIPPSVLAEEYGCNPRSVKVIAHKLGLKRSYFRAKSKLDWVARGKEVLG